MPGGTKGRGGPTLAIAQASWTARGPLCVSVVPISGIAIDFGLATNSARGLGALQDAGANTTVASPARRPGLREALYLNLIERLIRDSNPGCGLYVILTQMRIYFAARAASMACVTSGESGFTLESKRATMFPSRPITNFVKFQRMSPGKGESLPASTT